MQPIGEQAAHAAIAKAIVPRLPPPSAIRQAATAEALRSGLAEVWGAEAAGTLRLTLNTVIDGDPAWPAPRASLRT